MNYNKLLFKNERMRDLKATTERSARLFGDSVLYEQIVSATETETISFNQMLERTNAIGTQLIAMGLKGKHIAIVGESSIEWMVAYLSIVNGTGVAVPIDKELQPDTMAIQFKLSDTEAVFCSAKVYKKVKQALAECPDIKYCIVMRAKEDFDFEAENCLSYTDVMEKGRKLIADGDRSFIDAEIDPDQMADIIFTSGTTGANKGVMLSHKNICATIFGAASLAEPSKVSISALPINHAYEKNTHLLVTLYRGAKTCFNDDLRHLSQNYVRFKPDRIVVVPAILDAMVRKINVEIDKAGLTKNVRKGIKISKFLRKFGIDKRREYFAPILEKFGGNLNLACSGAAPLSEEVAEALDNFGINVLEGYGISECSPLVSMNGTKCLKFGTVGVPAPGVTVTIGNPDKDGNGEILVKGDNVMLGYYKDEESTKAVFTEDGWFKTGDIGHMDKDGYLYISGRIKNLIILPNGKNVFPEELEDKLVKQIAYIKEVVVYADEDNTGIYAACYLDDDYLTANGVEDRYAYLMNDIAKFNTKVASFKKITNVVIYDTEFEKTTTKKIKRFAIERRTANV